MAMPDAALSKIEVPTSGPDLQDRNSANPNTALKGCTSGESHGLNDAQRRR